MIFAAVFAILMGFLLAWWGICTVVDAHEDFAPPRAAGLGTFCLTLGILLALAGVLMMPQPAAGATPAPGRDTGSIRAFRSIVYQARVELIGAGYDVPRPRVVQTPSVCETACVWWPVPPTEPIVGVHPYIAANSVTIRRVRSGGRFRAVRRPACHAWYVALHENLHLASDSYMLPGGILRRNAVPLYDYDRNHGRIDRIGRVRAELAHREGRCLRAILPLAFEHHPFELSERSWIDAERVLIGGGG